MKKLLLLGLMTVAAMGGFAQEGRAWFLDGCCGCNSCGCSRYTTIIRIRPYNAFSPVCCGSLTGNGCMPIMCGGCCPCPTFPCCAPPAPCMPTCYVPQLGGGSCTSGCCDGGCLPPPGSFANGPMPIMPGTPLLAGPPPMNGMPMTGQPLMPGQPMPQGQPGPLMPMPQPAGQVSYMNYGYMPVQPASYMPGYQPMYNPYYYPPMYGYGR